jgi:hypothetical protein
MMWVLQSLGDGVLNVLPACTMEQQEGLQTQRDYTAIPHLKLTMLCGRVGIGHIASVLIVAPMKQYGGRTARFCAFFLSAFACSD